MRTRSSRTAANLEKPNSSANESEFSLDLSSLPAPGLVEDFEELNSHHINVFEEDEALGSQTPAQGHQPTQKPLPLERRKLTLSDAEELLLTYREKSSFFPFITIPKEATISSLSRKSPFLLLAILTSASIRRPSLHTQIDYEFKRVLSLKVIIGGLKSLDFLQGLLIYIAWYPMHVNPKNNQAFMYLNLALSLAADMGLNQETPNLNNFRAFDTYDLIHEGKYTKDAKRAYLSCYFLSSTLTMSFGIPSSLQQPCLTDDHGQSLIGDELGTEIHSLLVLQRFNERIAEVHNFKKPAADTRVEAINAEMHVQIFLNELQEWKDSTPNSIQNLPFIGLAERFVGIGIYSRGLGLLRKPYREHLRSPGANIAIVIPHLARCLEACKTFFEYLLSIPESNYLYWNIVQYSQVVEAILVLSRLAFLMATKLAWDSNTMRSNIPLVMYLDCLCYRFQQLSSTDADNGGKENVDMLYVFRMILGSVKRAYERRVAKIEVDFGNGRGPGRGHCPVLDPTLSDLFAPTENLPSSTDLFEYSDDSAYNDSFDPYVCSILAGSGSGEASRVSYHNIWATMNCSWANEG